MSQHFFTWLWTSSCYSIWSHFGRSTDCWTSQNNHNWWRNVLIVWHKWEDCIHYPLSLDSLSLYEMTRSNKKSYSSRRLLKWALNIQNVKHPMFNLTMIVNMSIIVLGLVTWEYILIKLMKFLSFSFHNQGILLLNAYLWRMEWFSLCLMMMQGSAAYFKPQTCDKECYEKTHEQRRD